MSGEMNPERQLSEIHDIIAESRSQSIGGGVVAVVWTVLTAVAVAVLAMRLVPNSWTVWAVHNCVGWVVTLAWFQRASKAEGRVSRRGISVLRLWAGITLAVWLCIWSLVPNGNAVLCVLPVLLGIGVLGTGLIHESTLDQCVGVLIMISGPAIIAVAPHSVAWVLVLTAIAVLGIIWGISSWLVKERR